MHNVMNVYYILGSFLGLLTWSHGPIEYMRDAFLESENQLEL